MFCRCDGVAHLLLVLLMVSSTFVAHAGDEEGFYLADHDDDNKVDNNELFLAAALR